MLKRMVCLAVATAFCLIAVQPIAAAGPDASGEALASSHRSSAASAMPRVEIFSSPSCKYCVMAKDYFRDKGVRFVDYNVTKDVVAATRMYPLNPRGVLPFVIINGNAVVGYVPKVYDKLLADAEP